MDSINRYTSIQPRKAPPPPTAMNEDLIYTNVQQLYYTNRNNQYKTQRKKTQTNWNMMTREEEQASQETEQEKQQTKEQKNEETKKEQEIEQEKEQQQQQQQNIKNEQNGRRPVLTWGVITATTPKSSGGGMTKRRRKRTSRKLWESLELRELEKQLEEQQYLQQHYLQPPTIQTNSIQTNSIQTNSIQTNTTQTNTTQTNTTQTNNEPTEQEKEKEKKQINVNKTYQYGQNNNQREIKQKNEETLSTSPFDGEFKTTKKRKQTRQKRLSLTMTTPPQEKNIQLKKQQTQIQKDATSTSSPLTTSNTPLSHIQEIEPEFQTTENERINTQQQEQNTRYSTTKYPHYPYQNTQETNRETYIPPYRRNIPTTTTQNNITNQTKKHNELTLEQRCFKMRYKQILKRKMKEKFEKIISKSIDEEMQRSFTYPHICDNNKIEKKLDTRCIYDLEDFVKNMGNNNKQGLEEEYQILNTIDKQRKRETGIFKTARQHENKNRFKDYLANEKTKVDLTMGKCQYINANWVKGNEFELRPIQQDFIATQAPIQSTFQDFWVMLWEKQVDRIVVLGEKPTQGTSKRKSFFSIFSSGSSSQSDYFDSFSAQCDKHAITQYWPDKDKLFVCNDHIYVKLVNETTQKRKSLTIRKFELYDDRQKDENGTPIKRILTQFHYTDWPDMAVPSSEKQILSLVDNVFPQLSISQMKPLVEGKIENVQETPQNPVVVHCVAGVGRTGTFLAIAIALLQLRNQLEKKEDVCTSIFQVVEKLKAARCGMVQHFDQYSFIYQCLLARHKKLKIPVTKPNVFLSLQRTVSHPSPSSTSSMTPLQIYESDDDDECPSTPICMAPASGFVF